MRDQPWRDICPLGEWGELLDSYRRGGIESKGKTAGHKIAFFFGQNVVIRKLFDLRETMALPDGIVVLDQQIRSYHALEKRSLRNLAPRAQMLQTIGVTGKRFLAQHGVADKSVLKNEFMSQIESRNKLMNRFGNEAFVEKELEKQRENARDAYDEAKRRSLDYAVSKSVRRAGRKAEYIAELIEHVTNADRGFRIAAKNDFLQYIKGRAKQPLDDNLLNMQADVIMEKVDPWHRDWEMSVDPSMECGVKSNWFAGRTFLTWIRDQARAAVPFFVWLEGHELCTSAEHRDERSVAYHRADRAAVCNIELISPRNGSLWTCSFEEGGEALFDTSSYRGKPGGATMSAAYVWTSDGLILAAQHEGETFHHSSFVSGRRVRCSGMIRAKGGKVTSVDSDSGHYKPRTLHLCNFVEFLDLYDVFAPNAVVVDKSTDSKLGEYVRSFLAGGWGFGQESIAQRMVRIRRDWQRFSRKEVTLVELVEERFQAMRKEIGPAPSDDQLWTRAYKSVCLDFGEIDRSYLRKASAPPIPRISAREAARRGG